MVDFWLAVEQVKEAIGRCSGLGGVRSEVRHLSHRHRSEHNSAEYSATGYSTCNYELFSVSHGVTGHDVRSCCHEWPPEQQNQNQNSKLQYMYSEIKAALHCDSLEHVDEIESVVLDKPGAQIENSRE